MAVVVELYILTKTRVIISSGRSQNRHADVGEWVLVHMAEMDEYPPKGQ